MITSESTTTRAAGGLDFAAIGGKGGARSAPIVAGGIGWAAPGSEAQST
ncbi:MAG: hypothetical protein GY869_21175 [Planctomycetes bacterium]|nr:hypothetical protein [Planctomycetota bacterium]